MAARRSRRPGGQRRQVAILEKGERLLDRRRRAMLAPSSSAATSGPRKCGARPRHRLSTPAIITLSAATRILRRGAVALPQGGFLRDSSFLAAACRRPGRSPMRSWSPVLQGRAALPGPGNAGEDPTEPFHSQPYPFQARARRAGDREVRERLKSVACIRPPAARRRHRPLARPARKTPLDAFPIR